MNHEITKHYNHWKECLVRNLGSGFNLDFVGKRLAIYSDSNHSETKKFVNCYGRARLETILSWFQQAKEELDHQDQK
jgi:hypothetical protein